ncbi:MAG: YidC/Oxa1 family membrane protein insertase [Clostridiales bacterium]|jgi:YidC/Oxa1 family membrane protein insertase|nr:YidC/Oxa1 family membrane protein insertase [Eubacteriales bacterium]MDH7567054.1 YidC/Oxa1 family membrane protein insertase [Clostridiales bacterium]
MNLDFIAYPLGQFLNFIYNNLAFHIYGLAIIIFTIIIRLVLLPLTIKQYHSTAKMQEIQPQIQQIQKRYKGDPEKLNQELMKVYQENKVNPAGGCLPLLIQMPILIALYYVISQPLKFMLGKSNEVIAQLFNAIPATAVEKIQGLRDISILNYFTKHSEDLANLGNVLTKGELINMKFLGLNLGMIPSYRPAALFGPLSGEYLALLILPILACITTYIQSKIAMPASQASENKGQADVNASMTRSMTIMMPIMTLIFAFTFPAGLSLYWVIGNIIQIFSQMYINKFVLKKTKEVVNK